MPQVAPHVLLVFAFAINPCHREAPEVERFLGEWRPEGHLRHYSADFKTGGRYVQHSDTGDADGTWKLTESSEESVAIETEVGGTVDHLLLRFRGDGSVVWTSLNTNAAEIYLRR